MGHDGHQFPRVSFTKKTSKEIGDGGCYDNTKYMKYKTLDILSPDVHHSVVDVNITAKCLMFRPLNCNNNQASLKLQLHGCKVLTHLIGLSSIDYESLT